MDSSDYWKRLCEKNPSLLDEGDDSTMKIKVASFRKAIEQAFAAGRENGLATGQGVRKFEEMMRGFGVGK